MESSTLLNSSVPDLAIDKTPLTTSEASDDFEAGTNLHQISDDFDSFNGEDESLPGKTFMEPIATNYVEDEMHTNSIPSFKTSANSPASSLPSVPPPPPPPPPPPAPLLNVPPPPPFLKPPFGKATHDSYQDEKSSTKLRRLIWQKIPDIQIINADDSIWAENQSQIKLDFQTIDDLFTVENRQSKRKLSRNFSITTTSSELVDSDSSDDPSKRKISLLDSKRSLNIHIFLRQFKRSIEVLAESIQACEMSFMNYDKLLSLRKLLPNKDEVKTLEEFKGPSSNLDSADHFLLCIISIPHYKLRIDFMLLREEFDHGVGQIDQSILILKKAMQEIRQCYALPSILHLVLQAGNYLNRGASFGNASGFRLSSLKALTDTKANKPGITLMHYVAMELKKNDPNMMNWTSQVSSVDNAARISEEEIREQIKDFQKRVKTLKRKVADEGDDELRQTAGDFLKKADIRLDSIRAQEEDLSAATGQLATYLCENPLRFALSSCFEIVAEFRNKFLKAALENEKREEAERKRENKSKREDQNNNHCKSYTHNTNNNSSVAGSTAIVEEDRLSSLKKKDSFRRSYSLATPHRRFSSLPRQSTGRLQVPGVNTSFHERSRLRNHDLKQLHDISIVVTSPPEEKAGQHNTEVPSSKNNTSSRIPKSAWAEESSDVKPNAFLTSKNKETNDFSSTLDVFDSTSQSRCRGDSEDSKTEKKMTSSKSATNLSINLKESVDYDGNDSLRRSSDTPSMRLASASKEEQRKRSGSMIAFASNAISSDNLKSDDLEKSMDRFVQKERDRMFERTQLRRSFIRLPKDEDDLTSRDDDGSDSDTSRPDTNKRSVSMTPTYMRRKQFQRRFSPLASQSDHLLSSRSDSADMFSVDASRALEEDSKAQEEVDSNRHDDIRERIRRYKESESSKDVSLSLDRRRSSSSVVEFSLRRKSSSEDHRALNHINAPLNDAANTGLSLSSPFANRKTERSTKFASASFSQLSAMDENLENTNNNNDMLPDVAKETNKEETQESETTEIPVNQNNGVKSNAIKSPTKALEKQRDQVQNKTPDQNSTLIRRNSSLFRCRTPAGRSQAERQSIHFPIEESKSTSLKSSPERQQPLLTKSKSRTHADKPVKSAADSPETPTSSLDALKSSAKKKTTPGVSGVKTLISKLTQPKKKQAHGLNGRENSAQVFPKKEFKTAVSQPVREAGFPGNKKSVSSSAPKETKKISTTPRKFGVDKKMSVRPSPTASTNTSRSASPAPRRTQPARNINVSPSRPASRSSGLVSPPTKPVATSLVNKSTRLKQNQSQRANGKTTNQNLFQSLMKTPKSNVSIKRDVSPVKPVSNRKLQTPTKKKGNEQKPSDLSVLRKKTIPENKKLFEVDKQVSTKTVESKRIAGASPIVKKETTKNLQEIKETNLSEHQNERDESADKEHMNSKTPVQMNRAARLRLSKKLANKKMTTTSIII